jgi:hypothetical protein
MGLTVLRVYRSHPKPLKRFTESGAIRYHRARAWVLMRSLGVFIAAKL